MLGFSMYSTNVLHSFHRKAVLLRSPLKDNERHNLKKLEQATYLQLYGYSISNVYVLKRQLPFTIRSIDWIPIYSLTQFEELPICFLALELLLWL